MSDRPGFMIYFDDLANISELTDADVGKLIRMLATVAKGEEPTVPKKLLFPFNFMSSKVKRDAEAYDAKIEKRKKAAEVRWNANDANASNAMQTMQMHANAGNSNSNHNGNYNSNRNQTKPDALNYDMRNDNMDDVLMEA